MVFYVLAKLPEIQEKVREEIYEVVGDKDDVSYEDLTKLHYLSQVIQETLRMYPPTARTNRTCTEEIIIGGIQFKPQFTFSVPVYVIHYDERYYPEPEKFDPDRFLPDEKSKRDPLTYLPFGYGPRNCIGMRFADLEMRMAVVHLIKRFNFTPANDAPDLPVKINTSSLTRTEQVLYVNAEKI
uniref:Cytochrome P450 n=1 Tax=Acrobeloides nanus TaxID=290746 RepID=A0A914CKK2_9BILA